MQLAENVIIAGRFRLNRMLGRGGMGSVWHATHLGLDIPCAVKFIEGAFADLGEANARFEREAKAAAQLRSPHVVQILDHGIFENTPYIAMELLEGEDLGKRLDRFKRLPPKDIAAIIQQVSRALGKAHALGIVHRDLKPDNIYLVRDDDREIAKVLDFGIAKTKVTDVTSAKTRTGAMLGTPYYMSPEQAQGTRDVDTRSDLWSLGVIVYECLTGTRPFESEALGDLLIKILVLPIPVPSTVANVPPGFDAWWARAAAREPAHRFQTAKDLADSLSAVLGVPPDQALTGSTLPHPGPAVANMGPAHAAVTPFGSSPAAQTVAAPTPMPGVTPAPYLGPPPKLARTTGGAISRTYNGMNTPPPAKRTPWLAIAGAAVVVVAAAGGIGGRAYMRAHAASAPTKAVTTPPPPAIDPPPATDPANANADTPPATPDLPVVPTAVAPATASAVATAAAPPPRVPIAPRPKPQGTGKTAGSAGTAAPKPAGTDRAGF